MNKIFDRLILKFVCKYVMTHMGHTLMQEREMIFSSIVKGLQKEFYEDTNEALLLFIKEISTKALAGSSNR